MCYWGLKSNVENTIGKLMCRDTKITFSIFHMIRFHRDKKELICTDIFHNQETKQKQQTLSIK